MFRSHPARIVLAAVLGGLFVFAALEPMLAHCGDDDGDGACCFCLCTLALDAPEASDAVHLPDWILQTVSAEPTGFRSLTFRPSSPPPRA